MVRLAFEGSEYELAAGETVLDCLDRHAAGVPSFCRNGVCQACLVRATAGEVPAAAQQGLKETWRAQGWFLACQCRPAGDIAVERCDGVRQHLACVVDAVPLAERVLRVRLTRPQGFDYAAGQFVQVSRPADGLMRPYSLASTPDDALLELHVARLADGRMSGWLAGAAGQWVNLTGPMGECFYVAGDSQRPLLLAGTGTGLAPLFGVLRSALAAGHAGQIRLLHGAASIDGLYLRSALGELAQKNSHITFRGSVAGSMGDRDVSAEPLQDLIKGCGLPLSEARIYLCGNPEFVRTTRKQLYLAGTPLARIHADPFLPPANGAD